MIDLIRGRVVGLGEGYCVIETGGLGFRVLVSSLTQEAIDLDENLLLYTQLVVREDSMTLYGFKSEGERLMFELFNTVTGVGPKAAMSLLGTGPLGQLKTAILLGDTGQLKEAPGIGQKSAERIILELKDKVGQVITPGFEPSSAPAPVLSSQEEALEALMGLGYSDREARQALESLDKDLDTEELIRQALRALSR